MTLMKKNTIVKRFYDVIMVSCNGLSHSTGALLVIVTQAGSRLYFYQIWTQVYIFQQTDTNNYEPEEKCRLAHLVAVHGTSWSGP